MKRQPKQQPEIGRSHEWYHSKRWQDRRRHQLTLEPFCRYCRQLGRTTAATVADHVVPHKGDYDAFWTGELQSLCAPCHNGAKKSFEQTGVLRGCDANGLPLDPTHHWSKT